MANASCNSPLRFGYRFMGRIEEARKDSIKIDNAIMHDIRGMTLVVGPSGNTKQWFKITGVDGDVIRITEGDLLAFKPPVTAWQKSELKRRRLQVDWKRKRDFRVLGCPPSASGTRLVWKTFPGTAHCRGSSEV